MQIDVTNSERDGCTLLEAPAPAAITARRRGRREPGAADALLPLALEIAVHRPIARI